MMAIKKRGQVTIFIIIAVVLVALIVLLFLFYPKIKSGLGFGEKNPAQFLQDCLEEDVSEKVGIISSQGGSLEPGLTIKYENTDVEYLCYINEYYLPCVRQQPLLVNHVAEEIKKSIEGNVDACFRSLEESFGKQGYSVDLKRKDFEVELLPKRIVVRFEDELTLAKAEESTPYENFEVVLTNDIYELLSIANSILNWEARYGDSETTIYMNYYHNLKVEKKKQGDGSTIYILTNRDSEDKFMFASRSVAWPPGYGAGEIRI